MATIERVIRQPAVYGRLRLPFSDGFGRADGGLGLGWIGTSWAISSGKAVCTPVLGANLISNPEFTENTSGWGSSNGATLTRRDFASDPDIDPSGGEDNFGLEVLNTTTNGQAQASVMAVVGTWYQVAVRGYAPSANSAEKTAQMLPFGFLSTAGGRGVQAEDAWQACQVSGRATSTSGGVSLRCQSAVNGDLAYFDAMAIKPLTLSSLFATLLTSISSFIASVKVTLGSPTNFAGLVLCLDSPTNPQNFLIAYHDWANVKLDKCVNGAYTNLISTAVAYSAGAVLQVKKNGNTVQVFYGGTQRGTDQTVSDATLTSNKRHGMFSTAAINSLDDFSLARYA